MALEMFSEGLSSGELGTQIAAVTAANQARPKNFTLCVLESGFAIESCDKEEPHCL